MPRRLDTNVIYQGDAFEIIEQFPNESIDLLITDPPYLIESVSGGGSMNVIGKLNKSLQELDDHNIIKGYDIPAFAELVIPKMKNINMYFWCNKKQVPLYFEEYVLKRKCTFDILVWHKTNSPPTYSNKYISDCEYLLHFRKGAKCHPANKEDAKTVYIAPMNVMDKKKWGHPTIKPLDFTEKIIRNSSNPGDVILDPFCGSGTSCVGAKNMGRKYIGIEMESKWVNTAEERLME